MDGFVPVTKDSGYLPSIGSLVPNDQKFAFAEAFAGFNLAECVMPFFDGTKSFDRKNLHGSGRKYTAEISADILASFLEILLPRPGNTTIVVVKLDVWIQKTCMLCKLIGIAAVIERTEELSIQI
jgi:hypothetical protein